MKLVCLLFAEHQLGSQAIYNLTKQACDQDVGIISQCFKADYVVNFPSGYFDNFLLKVNGKIGGCNSVIDPNILKGLPFNLSRTMIVGVDVNHPPPTSDVNSSVSAAVGSYDPLFTKYSASIRAQFKEGEEIVKQLDHMINELLNEYKKFNKNYPDNVIVFRDGVSEGQFEQVRKLEIPLIEKAIKTTGRSIKLSCIVTQKRHHTRFVLEKEDTSGRRPTHNVPSGTVVDTTIVEPNWKVFYLNSHFSPLVCLHLLFLLYE